MRRSEQREHIFKLLFMTQFNTENEMPEQLSIYFEGLGEVSEKDQEAIQQKYDHILEHLEEIDGILNDYSRGWKTTRMNRVDLTALRLAVYEMKMDADVPVGVAINEAVELAKLFGGEDSGSFVNGVLGKIASGRKEDIEGAVEYLKALKEFSSEISPWTLKRSDPGYHSEDRNGSFASATAIRKAVFSQDLEFLAAVLPDSHFECMKAVPK